MKEFYQRPEANRKRKEYMKEYYKKHKTKMNNQSNNWYHKNKEKANERYLEYYKENKDTIYNQQRKYQVTPDGKGILRKTRQRRSKTLKDILLIPNIFPPEIQVEYHHLLNDFYSVEEYSWFVIPIPKITHNFVGGNTKDKGHWSHNAKWIKILFGIDVKDILSPMLKVDHVSCV